MSVYRDLGVSAVTATDRHEIDLIAGTVIFAGGALVAVFSINAPWTSSRRLRNILASTSHRATRNKERSAHGCALGLHSHPQCILGRRDPDTNHKAELTIAAVV